MRPLEISPDPDLVECLLDNAAESRGKLRHGRSARRRPGRCERVRRVQTGATGAAAPGATGAIGGRGSRCRAPVDGGTGWRAAARRASGGAAAGSSKGSVLMPLRPVSLAQASMRALVTATRSMAVARPLVGSTVMTAPCSRTSPPAGSKRAGMPVRNRAITPCRSMPMTPSCGPVMPASVRQAVPPGRIRSSAVWTCVCVPITAVTWPSSHHESAIFSDVVSAWKSTRIAARRPRARAAISRIATANGSSSVERKTRPIRLITPTCGAVGGGDDARCRRPGVPSG